MNTPNKSGGLSLFPLTALVVGSIIGSGMFNLPQNMAENAGGVAIVIAWLITFAGMLCLTLLYQQLSIRRPTIFGGPYGYAREGFGDFIGFSNAWGRWIASMSGNAAYLVMLMAAFGGFTFFDFFSDAAGGNFTIFNVFGGGTTGPATLGALVILWFTHFLVFMGVRTAAFINTIVTLAKVVPILFFIAVAVALFQSNIFEQGLWGPGNLGSLMDAGEGVLANIFSGKTEGLLFGQVRDSMLYTAWVFVGVESASIYSARAKDMKTVARATVLGFVITLVLYMSVSLLSLGLIPQAELATMSAPSMRAIMAVVLGPTAAMIINLGVIISVAGAFLAWTMLAAESLYITALEEKDTGPKMFGKTNSNGAPTVALWWTNIVVSIMLICAYFFGKGYNELILLATSMYLIPYLFSALYGISVAKSGKSGNKIMDKKFLLTTLLASVYSVWLIYAAGIEFLLASMILYATGILLFFYRRKEDKLPLIAGGKELACILVVIVAAVYACYALATGAITL